jgi:uncharacterized protein YodC (DUF2158 family)
MYRVYTDIGDIVTLKSGGSHMTITGITKTGLAQCDWHDSHGRKQTATYPQTALKVIRDPETVDDGGEVPF